MDTQDDVGVRIAQYRSPLESYIFAHVACMFTVLIGKDSKTSSFKQWALYKTFRLMTAAGTNTRAIVIVKVRE